MSAVEYFVFQGTDRSERVVDACVFVASPTSTYHTIYHVSILTRSFAIIRLGVGCHVSKHIESVKDISFKLVCSGSGWVSYWVVFMDAIVCVVSL